MNEEIKRKMHDSYLITVHPNKTEKKGKYRAYGRNFLGQTKSTKDAIKLPSYNLFGDDPDQLIQDIQSIIDRDFNK